MKISSGRLYPTDTDFKLGDRLVKPDVAFVSTARLPENRRLSLRSPYHRIWRLKSSHQQIFSIVLLKKLIRLSETPEPVLIWVIEPVAANGDSISFGNATSTGCLHAKIHLRVKMSLKGFRVKSHNYLNKEAGEACKPVYIESMKLGLVTYNMAKDWDVPTIIEKCVETGFSGVELRTTHAHGVEVELSASERAAVKQQFDDSPIEIAGLGSAFDYHAVDQEAVRQNIEGTKVYSQLAADVGAPGVKVRPNGLPEEVPVEKTLEQIGLALRECGEFAC